MTNFLKRIAWMIAATLLLGACGESRFPEATGKSEILGINAIRNSQSLQFKIEERQIATLTFGAVSRSNWDNLVYNFNFDVLPPGAEDSTRLAVQTVDVAADVQYTFSIIGASNSASIVQWEQPVHRWDGTETAFGVSFGHLASGFGDLDIFMATDGVPPAAGAQRASLGEGDFMPETELPGGDYVVSITPRGDPATIIFESTSFTLGPAASFWIVLFEPDASSTTSLGVRLMTEASLSLALVDRNSLPVTRLLHSAFGTGNVDLYTNGDFTAPLIADAAFGQVTSRVDTSSGTTPIEFTPSGNPGVSLLDAEVTNAPNGVHTLLFLGIAPDYRASNILDNPRSVATFDKFRVLQGSTNQLLVDIYVVDSGIEITDRPANFFAIPSGAATDYRPFEAGVYDVIVASTGTKTILASQAGVVLTNGAVTEFAVLDTADPNVLQLTQLP